MRERLSCGSNCELIPFLEDSFPAPAAEKPQAPPPLLNLLIYKKALSPFSNNKVSSRTGGIAQSYLSLKSVRSGSNFYSKFRLNSITWQGGLGGIFERMFIISIKRVSSYFPENQSYYSTLAKLMMKRDLDLSADDDDDVHSWLDALNEKELSRLRKNFLRN